MNRRTGENAINDRLTMNRRDVLRALGSGGAALAWPELGRAGDASEGAAFDAAAARLPLIAPFKGVSDAGRAQGDLRCESLRVTGRWPAALRGRFYRNGPALFERAGQRYHHWFDGDGMVQQFTFSDRGVAHIGRLVRTPKLAAERDAGRFLFPTFGTTIASEAPIQGPDSINVANTNAIEHAGRVLALWEGGSAFALDPNDLATRGPVTWKEGFEQVPFSAHPKLDRHGHLWNIGTFADKLVVWHIDAAGKLASVQTGESPYPNGMAHDVAITERYIVLPLPPIKLNFAAIARGATPEQAFVFERGQPLRILVMKKDDITERRVFELPAQMVFHVGNAYERRDGNIALSFVASADDEFLVHGAVGLVAGQADNGTGASLQSTVLDMRSGRASSEAISGAIEFPRIDPRRIEVETQRLVLVLRPVRRVESLAEPHHREPRHVLGHEAEAEHVLKPGVRLHQRELVVEAMRIGRETWRFDRDAAHGVAFSHVPGEADGIGAVGGFGTGMGAGTHQLVNTPSSAPVCRRDNWHRRTAR